MFISISNVYALDIQPGEWKMENIEMRTINPDTKEVLMDEKNSGIATLMCYTPKMSEDSKKMVKGFFYQCRRLHDNICRKYGYQTDQ
ncbi:putative inner membrane protein [Salmonella enterica subsp. enterica serovar Heidelberg]|nr:putative inner membrane protein [Salmonella enterica subsp. enterica serovar Heidelberg]